MKKYFLYAVLSALVMVMMSACAGNIYHKKVDLGGGDEADVVGRTGAFGTDLAAIRFKNKAPKVDPILRLQSFESRQVTTQSYDQDCSDPSQLRNINTTTVNERKIGFQDVANPNMPQDQIAVIGGSNPSTGNVAVPAALRAAGDAGSALVGGIYLEKAAKALRPDQTNIQQNGAGSGPVTTNSNAEINHSGNSDVNVENQPKVNVNNNMENSVDVRNRVNAEANITQPSLHPTGGGGHNSGYDGCN